MISAKLIKWYKQNARDLPWRNSADPYKVWLSEIILQQTRVVQGLPYYLKFTEAFPTIFDLAKAPEQKVLKLWEGLGYYSRARNLHHAAKQIVKEYKGKFPDEYVELKKLKGVGDYTAAAISSFCFNKPHAVVDGNVYRVLSRLFAIETPIDSTEGKKQFSQLANELIDKKNPGTYNQAIMEFGAIYCTPANPNCGTCIFSDKCLSGSGKATLFPVKSSKTKTRTRYFEYFFIQQKQTMFIEKRIEKDIWQNLYQLPLLEFSEEPTKQIVLKKLQKEILKSSNKKFSVKKISVYKKHLLSHQTIMTRFWHLNFEGAKLPTVYKQIPIKNGKKYPFPVLISNHLQEMAIFEKN